MPFLALVHLRELRCSQCGELLAQAGARSFIVDENGDPVTFAADAPPTEMTTVIVCACGHETALYAPNEIGAEDVGDTPERAPVGRDARLQSPLP